jgi:hypothetical protein
MTTRVSNKQCRGYVQERKPFVASNIFGKFTDDGKTYVVYSYGEHWPLFVHSEGVWFENEEGCSVTTSKHRTQSHPQRTTILLSLHWMKTLATRGYSAIAKERILSSHQPPSWEEVTV